MKTLSLMAVLVSLALSACSPNRDLTTGTPKWPVYTPPPPPEPEQTPPQPNYYE
jgi:hypothetical protein